MVGTRICYADIWIFPLPFATLSGKMVVQQSLWVVGYFLMGNTAAQRHGRGTLRNRRRNRHEKTTAPHDDDPGIGMRAAHMGSFCYIGGCNKSCPYRQRAYQYQGHQDGEQSSLHGGSSFYGSHISLPGLCAAKFLVGKVLRRAGSVVRPSYQKVSRKATGISRCWHNKSVWEV